MLAALYSLLAVKILKERSAFQTETLDSLMTELNSSATNAGHDRTRIRRLQSARDHAQLDRNST